MGRPLNQEISNALQEGVVIPAHPLALTQDRKLDEVNQRLLTRYYMASGAGGIAVGVHTTQFAIRNPSFNLLDPVLRMAAEEVDKAAEQKPFIKVAGICGPTQQALREAGLANEYGYDLGLLSLGGLDNQTESELIRHAELVAKEIPVIGFYLQPAVGGRLLSYRFWRAFAEIPNVSAIKVAAFNRYQTIDAVRAVCDSPRRDHIALYTGNDDNIIADLLTPYRFIVKGRTVEKRFVGGLLGHWAIWTQKACTLFQEIKQCIALGYHGAENLLARGVHVSDMNAAIFDTANAFRGSIAGVNEILFRQGLVAGTYCLDPREKLSPGQAEEIDRVCAEYEIYTDSDFVRKFLSSEKNKP